MLDSPEGVCPAQTRFEYPATFVLLSSHDSTYSTPRMPPQIASTTRPHAARFVFAITLDRHSTALRSTRNRPRTAVQGCVLRPLCAGDVRKQPRSKETTDERFRRSTRCSGPGWT